MRAKVVKDSAPSQNYLPDIEKLDDFSSKIGCRSQVSQKQKTCIPFKVNIQLGM